MGLLSLDGRGWRYGRGYLTPILTFPHQGGRDFGNTL